MINILCLKWGTKFSPTYVNRLYNAVSRNLTVPFQFHCLTEDSTDLDSDIVIHPLPHKLPGAGWWQKLYMFSDEVDIQGRILFFDLDTLITGNIDHLTCRTEPFVCLQDFFYLKENVGSAMMSWESGTLTHLWDDFFKSPNTVIKKFHPHGDQKWIQQQTKDRTYWQLLYPNQFVSFKMHCVTGVPRFAKVICYHGYPSIEQSHTESCTFHTPQHGQCTITPATWVEDYWNDSK